MSYRGHRGKNSDEHNTVRRYRADSKNHVLCRDLDFWFKKLP